MRDFEENREFAVKMHMYFKPKKGESLEEANKRIQDYLTEIEENSNNPCSIQVHETEEQTM